jgi:arylsulfatase A-like enzyme
MSRPLRLILPIAVIAVGAVLAVMRPWERPPLTVVLISLDTLRPQRLGVYGNEPEVSPRLDALAKEAVVFDQALAPSPWTLPSHMSMLTGLDPVAHGVRNAAYSLSSKVVTLAEALAAGGFRTAAFTDGGFVSGLYGFNQGFEVYDDERNYKGGANGFARLLPKALDWIEDTTDEPSFVFLHTFDVHTRYDEGDPDVIARFRERPVENGPDDHALHKLTHLYQQVQQGLDRYQRMDELLNDYDAGVFEVDRGVGRVIDLLKDAGRLENSLIIVTSDHGESFYDRDLYIGHGINLTDDEVHIPLIVRFPDAEGGGTRRSELVDLTDLPKTVLDVAGIAPPEHMDGESLAGLLRGESRHKDHVFGISQNTEAVMLVKDGYKFISPPSIEPFIIARRHLGPMTPPSVGATDPGTPYEIQHGEGVKLLHYDERGDPLGLLDALGTEPQLYDRAADPEELDNLYEKQPKRAEMMAAALKQMYEESLVLNKELDDGAVAKVNDSPHIQQQLNQLGYLHTGEEKTLHELPAALREPLTEPYEPPDTTLLTRADRSAHMARLAVAEGGDTSTTARFLRNIANTYTHWATRNPEHLARVGWRIAALMDIGEQAEIDMDRQWWEIVKWRFADQLKQKLAREAEAEAEAAENAPPVAVDPVPDETAEPQR